MQPRFGLEGNVYSVLERLTPRDQKIVFLISRYSFSAAELFVISSFHLYNSLIVGVDTGGGFRTPLGQTFVLPNTGLFFVKSSFSLGLPEYLIQYEGRGIKPDITVPLGVDPVIAVVNLLTQ